VIIFLASFQDVFSADRFFALCSISALLTNLAARVPIEIVLFYSEYGVYAFRGTLALFLVFFCRLFLF